MRIHYVKNLFKAVGSKVERPFLKAKRLYLVLSRAQNSVKVTTKRSSKSSDFVWPLPTSMSANGLNAITTFCAWKASAFTGDLKPEERYLLEREISSRIWEEERDESRDHSF